MDQFINKFIISLSIKLHLLKINFLYNSVIKNILYYQFYSILLLYIYIHITYFGLNNLIFKFLLRCQNFLKNVSCKIYLIKTYSFLPLLKLNFLNKFIISFIIKLYLLTNIIPIQFV